MALLFWYWLVLTGVFIWQVKENRAIRRELDEVRDHLERARRALEAQHEDPRVCRSLPPRPRPEPRSLPSDGMPMTMGDDDYSMVKQPELPVARVVKRPRRGAA